MVERGFLLVISLLLGGCLPSSRDDEYVFRMVIGRVIDLATGEPATGWRIEVNHHLAAYSGPELGEHFCQPFDNQIGEFRIAVAPTWRRGSTDREHLGIRIENNRDTRPYYKSTFYVPAAAWHDGSWRTPACTSATGSRPQYRLELRDER